jgi:hypothetical protein
MVEAGDNQGDQPPLDRVQVSVSPQGFGSDKFISKAVDFELRPLFTGRLYFAHRGLRRRDSRVATGGLAARELSDSHIPKSESRSMVWIR